MAAVLPDRWRDAWRGWRNRLVESAAFQRRVAGLPVVRRIGERHAAALFDLCAGFIHSQILLAAVRVGLLTAVRAGPLAADVLAARTGLSADAATRLADAAVALGLLERAGGERYGLGLLGAALLGTPGLDAMIRHHGDVYRDFADPVALLAGTAGETALKRFWAYGGDDPAAAERWSALMAATQGFVQGDVIDAYDFGRHRRMLDVGGGDGTFLSAVGRRHPGPELALFDRPAVVAIARRRFAAEGLEARARLHGGDFHADPLPPGADLVSFVRVLHDHDDAAVAALLSKARAALEPGGRVLIAEPMATTPGAERVGDAYFGFYLLAMGRGRPRTAERIAALLAEAGFTGVRSVRTRRPLLVSVMVGEG